jgi:hypothetical protein
MRGLAPIAARPRNAFHLRDRHDVMIATLDLQTFARVRARKFASF